MFKNLWIEDLTKEFVHIEEIQDQVELALMRSGFHDVARSYVLYREERNKARNDQKVEQKKRMSLKIQLKLM